MLKMLFSLLILISPYHFACEIKVGVSEIPPYSHLTPAAQWQGKDIELFNALAKRLNCKTSYVDVPFGLGLNLLIDGKIDAMPQLSKLPERVEKLWFVGPIRNESFVLITLKSIPNMIDKLADIKALPSYLAKQKNTFLGDEFERYFREDTEFSNKFFLTTSSTSRIELVSKRRIIGFISIKEHIEYMLKYSDKYQDMKMHPLVINNNPVYIGLSKKSIDREMYLKIKQAFTKLNLVVTP
jgi:polar amino acid transport system substrate-binding protein